MSDTLDLGPIRARYDLARMAGTAADDGGQGWDDAKIRAVIRSWQDVSTLHDAYLHLLAALPQRQCHEHEDHEPGAPHTYADGHHQVLTVCTPTTA